MAGVVGIVVLVNSGWPLPALGMGSRWVSNLQPPTVAMVFLGLAQAGVLALVERRQPRWLRHATVQQVTAAINALAMTVYLWHMPIVVVVFGLYILAPGRFGASASLTSERGDPVACPAPIGWQGRKDAS